MEFGLSSDIVKRVSIVFSKYHNIEKVIIYGSRALGTYKPGSDIDLTVIGKNITMENITKILNDLDDLNVPYQFDLCDFSRIQNDDLISHINGIGKIFYNQKK